MERLLRYLIFGDGHIHNWEFTQVTQYQDTSYLGTSYRYKETSIMPCIHYVKSCSVCGAHKIGEMAGCDATTPEELNCKVTP